MPKDVVLGVPVLSMLGREELYIENYRGILEYTEELIRVQTKKGQIKVTGCRPTCPAANTIIHITFDNCLVNNTSPKKQIMITLSK